MSLLPVLKGWVGGLRGSSYGHRSSTASRRGASQLAFESCGVGSVHYGTTQGQENLRMVCIGLQQETSLPEEHVRFMLFMTKMKLDSFIKM